MVLVYLGLVIAGLIMAIKPAFMWQLTEAWKLSVASERSGLYLWSTRLGGLLMFLAGLGGLIALTQKVDIQKS